MVELFAVLVLIAAVVATLHFRWDFFRQFVHPWLHRNADLLGAYRSIVGLLSVPIILIGGYAGFLQLKDALDIPDAVLIFSNIDEPRFWVLNASSKLLREPEYQFLLYNLSLSGSDEKHPNLQIPTRKLDYIRPNRHRGPWTLRSVALQGKRVQEGHHLFGYAQVQCPTCKTIRYYWIYVQVGTMGWYAEIIDEEPNVTLSKFEAIAFGGLQHLNKIRELVPSDRKISLARTD